MTGRIIRELREEKGLSRYKLAQMLGVTDQAIKYWEEGKCTPKTQYISKLAKLFQVSMEYLIGEEDQFGKAITPSQEASGSEKESTATISPVRKQNKSDTRMKVEITKEQFDTMQNFLRQFDTK